MKSPVVLLALVSVLAATGCRREHRERTVTIERQSAPQSRPAVATTTVVYEERPGEVSVYRQPPAPRDEAIVHADRPSPRHTWIGGHWAWYGHWEWIPGHWHRIPTGRRTWVAGRWQLQPSSGCHLWVGGHWE